ncbi:uncharacterized protein F5147DRAFT_651034 [Suillus discolor]|uniref:Uncharacterized protein n=1 Tax=Suillus discolor TaxID=1912936 RepID=A0A9P7JW48_9AGAM|nr:uncharacterized protein F5147DRAFT_651034 [Suillus discolor]KAG2111899.1 hypothetical protein F5147DRAFT_651034 [Suillus discolor]
MTSGGSPRKSVGLLKERRKVQKDYPDPDECEKLPEITMRFCPEWIQRKGCRDQVRSRIGPEDRGKVPEELPETWSVGSEERRSGGAEERRSGGAEERRSGGAEERRSGGAEERRSGGAELWPREFLPRPEMDID